MYIAMADNLTTIPVLLGGVLVEIALVWFEQGGDCEVVIIVVVVVVDVE